ncbi:UNVERIFIED_CONTAM: hypothetical protein Slati_2470000 [Sesamum latifolium]|uniref:Uncharacterized protein n=1 Tax=Sesamum latifolium TaxID=2727402 RepID=A0AAW2WDK7_9LAMI
MSTSNSKPLELERPRMSPWLIQSPKASAAPTGSSLRGSRRNPRTDTLGCQDARGRTEHLFVPT